MSGVPIAGKAPTGITKGKTAFLKTTGSLRLNVTWLGCLADQLVVTESSSYDCRVSFVANVHRDAQIMTIVKIITWLYLIQAAAGFAAGFIIPWL